MTKLFNLKSLLIIISTIFFSVVFCRFTFVSSFESQYCAYDEVRPITIQSSYSPTRPQNLDFKIKLTPKHDLISDFIKAEDIEKSIKLSGISKKANIILRDEKYSYVTLQWLDKYSKWWIDFIESNNITFEDDAFDCDNFSDLFMVVCTFSSRNYEHKLSSQIACGTLIVENASAFAGIPAKEKSWHSLNILYTDSGWFVIEPQNGAYISLTSYPNKDNIKAIIF